MSGQDEVIAFLLRGESYGLPGVEVDRVETHCSIVFLVGDRAYKLKRPVAFSSLDYSTIDRRETVCRAELDLNRRTAPELYLAIHAICRSAGGGLAFDGEGVVVDWVVEMRRFDQADLFDRLTEAGSLAPERIEALAEEIAQFHGMAERTPQFGGADGLRVAIERNLVDQRTEEAILGHEAVASLHKASCKALQRVAPLLNRRREEGRVRRCHGDLRLANICLLDGRPTLFDGIEFSEEVCCVDVLFDLAFVLMDLRHRGHGVLANVLFNRYLDITDESGGVEALPLMLSVRAATRAYSLAHSVQRQTRPGKARHHARSARAHMALALSLLSKPPARLIALGGIAGSSKTLLANSLAATFEPAPGARVLDSETVRKRLLDLPRTMRLPASAYRTEMSARLHARLATEAAQAAKAGITAIIDASFVHPAERQAIAAAASAAQLPFVGLWLDSPRDLQTGEAAAVSGWHAIRRGPDVAAFLAAALSLTQASEQNPGRPPNPADPHGGRAPSASRR